MSLLFSVKCPNLFSFFQSGFLTFNISLMCILIQRPCCSGNGLKKYLVKGVTAENIYRYVYLYKCFSVQGGFAEPQNLMS